MQLSSLVACILPRRTRRQPLRLPLLECRVSEPATRILQYAAQCRSYAVGASPTEQSVAPTAISRVSRDEGLGARGHVGPPRWSSTRRRCGSIRDSSFSTTVHSASGSTPSYWWTDDVPQASDSPPRALGRHRSHVFRRALRCLANDLQVPAHCIVRQGAGEERLATFGRV